MFLKIARWTIFTSFLLVHVNTGIFSLKAPVTCFKCDHVLHPSACNITTKCNDGEICAIRKYHGSNGEYQASGCIDEKKCTVGGLVISASPIVGKRQNSMTASSFNVEKRQADTLVCEKCCYGDKCNVLNCTISSAPVCVDKVSQCSSQLYRDAICQDDNNAILFCQKSCGRCPIDGGFSNWLPWSDCSVSCGGQGETFRVRSCNDPLPQYNGRPCQGKTADVKQCDNGHCPVDGHWGTWGQWSSCNATCGGGIHMRMRSCSNPAPKYGGKPCAGPASSLQTEMCNNQSCRVDGNWSSWGQWSPCDRTCGGGTSMRIRSCSNPAPSHGGQPCANPASAVQAKSCNNQSCPVDGNWSSWGQWYPCDRTCGGGTSMRIRSCSNPAPRNGGQPCANPASAVQAKSCNNQSCSVMTTPVHIPTTTTLPSTPGHSCQDHALCSDPHTRQIACTDLYLATTFCPRLCHKCGPTVSPPVCTDLVGKKCQEPLFQYFTCADPDLVQFCRLTCGACHK